MPQHPEDKNQTTPNPSPEPQPGNPDRQPPAVPIQAAQRLPPLPRAAQDPRRKAEQLLTAFLVHRELTRTYVPGNEIAEVSPEQQRLWSETYAAQRIHLVDLIAAGIESGQVLF